MEELSMKNSSISRILLAVAPIIVAGGLIASGTSVVAQSLERHCSNRTLVGDYGFALEGEILGPGIQLRGVVMQRYDGRGHLTQVDHIVTSGFPPAQEWRPGSGTYAVNPDCTGVAVINIPGDPGSPVNLHFVVVRHGTQIHQVVDASAVAAVGIKVD
jgi:hypothetical protein